MIRRMKKKIKHDLLNEKRKTKSCNYINERIIILKRKSNFSIAAKIHLIIYIVQTNLRKLRKQLFSMRENEMNGLFSFINLWSENGESFQKIISSVVNNSICHPFQWNFSFFFSFDIEWNDCERKFYVNFCLTTSGRSKLSGKGKMLKFSHQFIHLL